MKLQSVHIACGVLGLLLFVAQGQYMTHILGVSELADGSRLMYRTGHIYLLLTSALNVCVGVYMPRSPGKLQLLASLLLLVTPLMVTYSFLAESTSAELHRPAAVYALYMVFAATVSLLVAHTLAVLRNR